MICRKPKIMRLRAVFFILLSASLYGQCPNPQPVPSELKLPASLPAGEPFAFERQVLGYLSSYKYRDLGWCVDKSVRDTGPFIGGVSYGTHTAVRIYYSAQVIQWLRDGRQGAIADGAVIIKEQYGGAAPAEKYDGWNDSQLRPTDWTFMIRKAGASKDGWFWGEVWTTPAMSTSPTQYPNAGFDLYCLRCHASAEKEYTFSSLHNVKGFPGDPLTFNVDNSWRQNTLNLLQRALLPEPLPAITELDADHSQNRLASLRQEVKALPLTVAERH